MDLIVKGCNYHTKWQSNKSMRFILTGLKDGKAKLETRVTKKSFWTNAEDLIFITTEHNKRKAAEILGMEYKLFIDLLKTYNHGTGWK